MSQEERKIVENNPRCYILLYSLRISLTNFHFFEHLNNFLTNKLLRNEDTVKVVFKEFFHSKTNEITELLNHWGKCIQSNGNHFNQTYVTTNYTNNLFFQIF
ncbi:Histone-lysine N-methyltransferase SETMAR [Habropoda laboriosa]|uniref:Histone-lysine N-methyltransferase SETMAR n=1 Tax=Habropoda laboriosa TaxID=597456 RepID=A0A0L7QNR0_9HYME|nr:Histone-lysine N-methyltransferase SETMAR [Habropoda laboriosa]